MDAIGCGKEVDKSCPKSTFGTRFDTQDIEQEVEEKGESSFELEELNTLTDAIFPQSQR